MSLSKVDLPQPLGPTTVTNCPRGIFKLIFWRAVMAPLAGVRKSLETSSTWMIELSPGWVLWLAGIVVFAILIRSKPQRPLFQAVLKPNRLGKLAVVYIKLDRHFLLLERPLLIPYFPFFFGIQFLTYSPSP